MTDQLALAGFPGCHGCGNFRDGPAWTCLTCASRQLVRPGTDACGVCSQRLDAGGECANELCHSRGRRVSKIHAIGYQTGPLRLVINSYKYRGTRSWSVVLGRLILAWLEETLAGDPPGLIVVNPGYAGPGGDDFAHAEAVLAAAARADARKSWYFDTVSPAAVVKTRATLKSADAQAWAKRATGNELRSALRVPDPARTAGLFVLVFDYTI
jgi:hypothetical protein